MYFFAKVELDSTISEVIAIAESDCDNLEFPDSEIAGKNFIASLGKTGTWLQTSQDNEYRRNYASATSKYITSEDIFTHAQPFPSWSLNSNYEWQAPSPKPEEDGFWDWNETEQRWVR